MSGFTVVELMIAMLLGLIVMAGAGSIFVSSQRVYRTNSALADVQDSARVAFELLARDIRHAGGTACGSGTRVANVLNDGPVRGGTAWWANWGNALHGYAGNDPAVPTGSASGDRVAGTHSLQVLMGEDTSYSVASHDPSAAQFVLNEGSSDWNAGDVFIVCDYDHAAIFKSSSYSAKTLGHAMSGGNCSLGLGFPTSCDSANVYAFGANAYVTRLNVSDWYVGKNPDGGLSLYRLARAGNQMERQELVRGVTRMEMDYHQPGLASAFAGAASVTDWTRVTAVRIALTLRSNEAHATVDNAPLERRFTMTATLRNRVP